MLQGRAIEEARSNVEGHYRYILGEHTAFMQKCVLLCPV